MNSSKNYSLITARALVLVLLVTSIGFTANHHECAAPTHSCCAKSDAPPKRHCDSGGPVAEQLPVIKNSCHTNTLVGVVITSPAIVPKDTKSSGVKHDGPAPGIPALDLREIHNLLNGLDTDLAASPPIGPKKYLLNSSLLI